MMSTNGSVNGVIVNANSNPIIKSEIIEDDDSCRPLLINRSTISSSAMKTNDSNSNLMIFCGQKSNLRQRNDSVSSMSTISTTNMNSNAMKAELNRKSHQNNNRMV